MAERPVKDAGAVRFDRQVRLNERLATQRRNPLSGTLRSIGVRIGSGRELVLLSNDLDSPAEAIADLYKTRWQVELFFKWLKQNLKIAHFLGTSRNAVTIQIMAALIVYLLIRIAQLKAKTNLGLQAIARLIQPLALARRCLAELLLPPKPPPKSPHLQLTLKLSHA
jgi:IS4 transposase